MKVRSNRLIEIRRILRSSKINSQEDLLVKLDKKGYHYTQATLSRDLRFLKVGKRPDEKGNFVYFLADEAYDDNSNINEDSFHLGFRSIEFSRNLAIIRTSPGFASGLAYAIDNLKSFEILGTIAGDDTILIISRDGSKKSDIINKLSLIIPNIE
jgi:transcriptional regulator of arginine metabolism